MIYQNETVRIRPFVRADMTDTYRSWFHDPETTKYNSHGLFPYTPGQMDAFIKTIEQGDTSKIVWAIEIPLTDSEKEQGKRNLLPLPPDVYDRIRYGWKHVGNCSLQSINLINRSAELAIVIGEASARGKGIGAMVCSFVLDHAFLALGLYRVWTGTAAVNVGMNHVCSRIGMIQEGVFKAGALLKGEYVDVNVYGITRPIYDDRIEFERRRNR